MGIARRTRRVVAATLIIAVAAPATNSLGASSVTPTPQRSDADAGPTVLDAEALDEVLTDPTVQLVDGALRVSEPPLVGPEPPDRAVAADMQGSPTTSEAVSESEALSLHSKPSASRVIFLDVDGHVITGSAWNSSPDQEITVGAYSRESKGQENETFSQSELDAIVAIWELVAEDFAPWDVDVTTEDPGPAALARSGPGDEEYGARVVITHDSSWYGSSGGVAYINSFGSTYYAPAFVFSNNLGRGNPKYVGEAAAHEAGHTLGLYHDGRRAHTDSEGNQVPATGYYSGHGSWAPIMGVGYSKTVTQWSQGEYAHADQDQDDLAEIDDHLPGRIGAAPTTTPLGDGDSTTLGALGTGGGADSYLLTTSGGPTSITLAAAQAGGNLLADLTVTNTATGETITRSPSSPTTWTHTVEGLGPGTYEIEVGSVGWLTPDDGFSDYASIGRYALTVDIADVTTTTTTTSPPTTTTTTTTSTTAPSSTTTTTTTPATTTPTTTTTTSTSTTTTTPTTTTTTSTSTTTTTPTTTTTTPPTTTSTTTSPTTTTAPPTTSPPRPPDGPGVAADRLTPFSPRRILDTRDPGARHDRLDAGETIRIPVAGVAGIADDATAAVVNVVAVRPTTVGFVSITPCNPGTEPTSALNYGAGSTVANSTFATLGDDGDLCILSSAETDIVVDVTAAIGPSGTLGLTNTTVRRVADTRARAGLGGRLTRESTNEIDLAGIVAPGTRAVAVNLTAAGPASDGYLTVDDCSDDSLTASLNYTARTNRGNNGVFALSPDQRLCVATTSPIDLVVDLTGEFGAGGLGYVAAEPVRLLDTRDGDAVDAGAGVGYDVPRPPRGAAVAASVNLASVGHPRDGFVTSWNCGPLPFTSALNPVVDQVTANGALVPLDDTGRSCLLHDAGGHLVVDLNGWWV